jgi:hypothetical protein
MQGVQLAEPLLLAKAPGAQGMQLLEPFPEYAPAGQGLQLTEPSPLDVPAGHTKQDAEPGLLEYVPAGQGVQVPDFVTAPARESEPLEYVPAGHKAAAFDALDGVAASALMLVALIASKHAMTAKDNAILEAFIRILSLPFVNQPMPETGMAINSPG